MLYKAKRNKQAARECEELRQQAKRKGDSRGVDPSATKQQKSEKRAEEKGKAKVTKETYFASSDSEEDEIEIKALPIDLIWRKRVIRCKIVREKWMLDHGLSNVMEVIKRQKWESLFKRRELVHTDAVKEFYAKLIMSHNRKKTVAKSKVEEPVTETPVAPAVPAPSTVQQKVTETLGVDPSCPTGRISEAVMNKMQAEFERARANRFQADLEKAQAENA
ncbi:hypothetical protein Dimus_022666 [Dionaea muscipula]